MNYKDPHQAFALFFKEQNLQNLAYALSKGLEDGHIALDPTKYNSEIDLYLEELKEDGLEPSRFPAKLDLNTLHESHSIGGEEDRKTPFIHYKGKFYLQRYFRYQQNIVEWVDKVSNQRGLEISTLENSRDLFKILFDNQAEKVDWQLAAVINSITKRFSIITGGPGTGKTTTVSKLLAIYLSIKPGSKVILTAPTGKAAARMNESVRNSLRIDSFKQIDSEVSDKISTLSAETIHRVLGWRKGTHYFKHDSSNPIDYDLVVVDESSMIDLSLMWKLLSSLREGAQIILLGDKNQLASVEAGSIFGDLCKREEFYQDYLSKDVVSFYYSLGFEGIKSRDIDDGFSGSIVELKVSRRFKDNSGIGLFSRSVISGDTNILLNPTFYNKEELLTISSDYSEIEKDFKLYRDYLKEDDIDKALDLLNSFRVLTTTNDGELSVDYFNSRVEKYLNLNRRGEQFYHNQPLMITKNNHQLELYNGDIGLVREDKGRLYLYLSSSKRCSVIHLSSYKTAFAMTIHKSQGSEFETIAVVMPQQESKILSRELLYTAITRGREKVFLYGERCLLKDVISKKVKRGSGLV